MTDPVDPHDPGSDPAPLPPPPPRPAGAAPEPPPAPPLPSASPPPAPAAPAPAPPSPSAPPAAPAPAAPPPASAGPVPPPAAPPGAGPAAGEGPTGAAAERKAPLLSWLALLAIVLSVLVEEHGTSTWEQQELWSAFAIATTALTVVPSIKGSVKLDDRGAWRVAAAGLAGLGGYWLLLVLPRIAANTSFLATVALVAAGAATWSAPGRPPLDER